MNRLALHDYAEEQNELAYQCEQESRSLRSASPLIPWDERLLGHIGQHIALEMNATNTYERLAEICNPQIKYLADLITVDELHHHEMLSTLAASVEALADEEYDETEWSTRPPLTAERRRLVQKKVRELLAVERRDAADLKQLRRDMRLAPEATMWSVIVEVMLCDAEKHVRVLKAIERGLKHPAWR